MRRYVAWGTELRTVMILVLTALVLTALVPPLVAAAQPPAQVRRIAFLGFGNPPSASEPMPLVKEFRQGLRERGWVEGDTIAIEERWAEGSLERFATLVAEVIRLPVEVLVVPNATTALIAKQATTTIPIVVTGAGSLLNTGLIASLARPGGNVTGFTNLVVEAGPTRLELLKEALPGVTRVAVLRGTALWIPEAFHIVEATARSLGMELQFFEVREPTAFERAFAAMTHAQADALFLHADPFFLVYRAQIAALAVQHRLPSIGSRRELVEAGVLMSYGVDPRGRGQRVAAYVDKILKGATPAELPIEQSMKLELVINLKTAQALGLTLSPMFLFRADEVIR